MQKEIFKPRYSIKGSWDVLSLSLLMIIALLLSFLKFGVSFSNVFETAFLILFILYFSRNYIRRIEFKSSCFVVEKYVWPSKKIDYSDVTDLGMFKVKTRKGDVSFGSMSNAKQLHLLFSELIKQGKINKSQIENKVVIQEINFRKSIIPTIVISSILWGVVLYFWPYGTSRFSGIGIWFSLFIIFVLVMLVINLVIKKRG